MAAVRYVRCSGNLRVLAPTDTLAVVPAPAFVPPRHSPKPVAAKLSDRLLQAYAADRDDVQGHAA